MSTPSEPAAEQFPLYTLRATDPGGELVDRGEASEEDLAQIDAIMAAMGRLRTVERELAEAAQAYMRLNETDMRAIHYLMIAENQGRPASPSALARYLRITTASTTKLLDRLEAGEHIVRHKHPSDRRALTVSVSPSTRASAIASMGRHQASRVAVAAAMSPDQRHTVIEFLRGTADALTASLHRE